MENSLQKKKLNAAAKTLLNVHESAKKKRNCAQSCNVRARCGNRCQVSRNFLKQLDLLLLML
jgi:hypothetical protein